MGEQGGVEDYVFRVTGVFRKCLNKQGDEGLIIIEYENEGGVVMNSKN